MRSRRSRSQQSISLELLIGVVVGLMVLSFLAGWFLGGRHAVKKLGSGTAAVTVAAESAAVQETAAETKAEEKAAETKAPETTAAPTTAAETKAPETAAPETTAASTTAAPTTAAETKAPETTAAPTTAAETAAPETAAPETTAAETAAPTAAETAAPTAASEITAAPTAAETAAPTEAAAPETTAAPTAAAAASSAGPGRQTTGDEEPGEAPTYLDTVIKTSSLNGVASGTVLSASEVDTANPESYNMILSIAEGDYTYSRMQGRSLKENTAVALEDLRYVKVLHYDNNGDIRVGELVVHKDILNDVTAVFADLFRQKYPINSMYLIDNYFGGGTAASAEAMSAENNNTTAFCGGAKTGSGENAAEAYGKGIILNPGRGALEDAAAAVFEAHGFRRNGNRYEKMQ